MEEQLDIAEVRRELSTVLAELDGLPRDAFAERAPLRERADRLRADLRSGTLDAQVVRDAERLPELRRRAAAIRTEAERIAGSGIHGSTAAAGRDGGVDGGDGQAATVRLSRDAMQGQGLGRLQADLGTLTARIAAAERYLDDEG